MTLFNLVHFFSGQDGRVRSGRWRSLGRIGFAALLLQLPAAAFAQSPDWGQWVEPTLGSDNNKPPGIDYPGGQAVCDGRELAGRHAYWRCYTRCGGGSGGWGWGGSSDATF